MNKRAAYTKVNDEQAFKIDCIREIFSSIYDYIDGNCKDSRETRLAITKLEEAQMWLIKGVSREV